VQVPGSHFFQRKARLFSIGNSHAKIQPPGELSGLLLNSMTSPPVLGFAVQRLRSGRLCRLCRKCHPIGSPLPTVRGKSQRDQASKPMLMT